MGRLIGAGGAIRAAVFRVLATRRGLVAVVAVFIAIVAAHLDAIPFWDGKNYLRCVETAVNTRFSVFNFRCFGHPSVVYLALWGVTQYARPWSPAPIYAVNAIVGAGSIVAFDALVRRLFPNQEDVEYTLVTALYALAPLFVAHAIFLNLDFGTTAFAVLFLYFLIAGRFWMAGASGVALIFTKETGLAVCAVTTSAYLAAFVFQPGRSWGERAAVLRSHGPLLVVPLALVLYLVVAVVMRHEPGGWVGSYLPVQAVPDAFDAILNTNLADASMRSFVADIFLLNFQWLYTVAVAASLCAAVIRVDPGQRDRTSVPRRGVFIGLALAGLVYIVTRYRFSNGARYVLVASPLLLIAFYHALLALFTSRWIRAGYLVVAVVLVFVSNFRSIDVVSRAFFGTIPFGSHRILNMTSLSGGLNLDSIVYNLEFLQLQYLFGDMVEDVRPRPGHVLLMGNAIYNFPPDVDGRDYRLTANPAHALPLFVAMGDVSREVIASQLRRDGDLFHYVAFANADNAQLRSLLATYEVVATKTYNRFGYTLDLYTFRFTFDRRRAQRSVLEDRTP